MKITKEQKSFLDEVVTGKWSINPNTGLVDVDGNVFISDMKLTEIPIKFGEVTGYFNCSINQLASLEGAPQSVGGDFFCQSNQLTSLEGAPKSVGGDFHCFNNKLTSLEGAPKSVGGIFNCPYNQLTSLVGAPKSVVSNFYCFGNQLTSLVGAPQSVGSDFCCRSNKLTSLEGAPQSIGGMLHIDLGYISKYYYHVIIPEIEEMIKNGIKLYKPDEYYYPYKEIHYKNKLIELL
jgi:hypothetical protein